MRVANPEPLAWISALATCLDVGGRQPARARARVLCPASGGAGSFHVSPFLALPVLDDHQVSGRCS
jgi:hypothetical protein